MISFVFAQDIQGNNNAGKYREDDWKTAFNEKAKHQVEKKNNFHGKCMFESPLVDPRFFLGGGEPLRNGIHVTD